MESLIFFSSFAFSFSLFIIGIWQKSFILSLSGSLLLLILSIILVSVGVQSSEGKIINLNITNSSGDVVAQDILRVNIDSGMNDPMTYSFGFTMGIFSTFFLLYSTWQYLVAKKGAGE